jgi:hypothetical protein
MTDNITTPIPSSTTFKTKDTGAHGHMPAHVLFDTSENEVMGTVTSSPTANTVLGRLKDVQTAMNNVGAGGYKTVAASQTHTVMGATGATGDYFQGLLVVPATTSPGAVSITDGSGSDITVFAGGASSVSNLVPFFIPLGMISTSGAWKVTTGSNVSCIGVGKFT